MGLMPKSEGKHIKNQWFIKSTSSSKSLSNHSEIPIMDGQVIGSVQRVSLLALQAQQKL